MVSDPSTTVSLGTVVAGATEVAGLEVVAVVAATSGSVVVVDAWVVAVVTALEVGLSPPGVGGVAVVPGPAETCSAVSPLEQAPASTTIPTAPAAIAARALEVNVRS